METKTKLDELIETKIEESVKYGVDTDKFGFAVEALAKLYEAKNACDKIEVDRMKMEQQLESEKNKNLMDKTMLAVNVGTTALTTLTYIWSTKMGFRFEEHGTITSQTFKSVFQKINPFKK